MKGKKQPNLNEDYLAQHAGDQPEPQEQPQPNSPQDEEDGDVRKGSDGTYSDLTPSDTSSLYAELGGSIDERLRAWDRLPGLEEDRPSNDAQNVSPIERGAGAKRDRYEVKQNRIKPIIDRIYYDTLLADPAIKKLELFLSLIHI